MNFKNIKLAFTKNNGERLAEILSKLDGKKYEYEINFISNYRISFFGPDNEYIVIDENGQALCIECISLETLSAFLPIVNDRLKKTKVMMKSLNKCQSTL